MKKIFLKSFCARFLTLLVLALLSTNLAWGEIVTLTENFSSSNATNNQYDCSSNISTENNRNDWDYVWTYSGSGTVFKSGIKLGAKSATGSVSNSTMLKDIPAGTSITIKVYAAVWNTDGGKVKFTYNGNSETKGAANNAITSTSNTYNASDFASATEFSITKAEGVNEIKIESSQKRILIDKVEVVYVSVTAKTLQSIAVKTAPTTTSYNVGDKFNPAGLVITATYDTGDEDIAYAGNESDFTFSPDLNTALTTSNTSVTITYGDKETAQAITVNKIATSLAWSSFSYEATISEQNEYPTLTTTPANLEGVTYSSSNTDVATIDATTGDIELIAEGETTITASFAGDDTYQPATDATYTLTVKQSSDTRTPVNITNVSAGQTTLVKGKTTTLTVTNDQLDWTPSYIYESNNTDVATVSTDGVITAVGKGAATITVTLNIEETDPSYRKGETPSMEIEITVNNPSHTAKFSVNGVIDESMNFTAEEGDKISFPGNPSAIDKYVFKGWLSTTLEPQQSEPTYIDTENVTMGTEDITYYAVFVKKEGTEPTLTKLGEDATFSNGDNIVIVATGDSWAKALYQETVSTSYVNFYEFDNNVTTIMADEKNYVTLTGSDNETWKLGDATNGYVYNATSNNLTVDKNNSSNWTIAWDESKSKYSIKNVTRWLSCRSDLTGDNQYKFRGGGTSPANGTVYFDIYKLIIGTVTYSNYCTTVPPRKIAVSVSENAATGLTTMYVDYATEIPEGVEAWYVSAYDATEDKLTMTQINGYVPANTAIIVKGTAGESYNFVETFETVDAISGTNLLTGSVTDSEAQTYTIDDGWYYLATSGNFKKYEGIGIVRKAHKAYLQLTERAWSQSAKELTIDWGEPTGIKTIDNGQLTIDNSKAYNLNGVRVNQAYKGIVIMNGKKYINK